MKREKLVLAYSGGLDTSVIVHWLNKQGYEVIALCLDLGQKVEDLDAILEKGKKAGATKVLIENVEEEFVFSPDMKLGDGYDPVVLNTAEQPIESSISAAYPNPFNPTTTLRFDLPEVSDVNVVIYNMLGQKVRTLNMNSISAGSHSIKWNATNDLGDPVGAGVYLYKLQAQDFIKPRKMILLK